MIPLYQVEMYKTAIREAYKQGKINLEQYKILQEKLDQLKEQYLLNEKLKEYRIKEVSNKFYLDKLQTV